MYNFRKIGNNVNLKIRQNQPCPMRSVGGVLISRPDKKGGKGAVLFGPCDVLGSLPSLRNIKYTRMCHFKKQNSNIFSPDAPHENAFSRPRCGF